MSINPVIVYNTFRKNDSVVVFNCLVLIECANTLELHQKFYWSKVLIGGATIFN
jgi:hypothetical protein